jgi:hypothetical protein
MYGGVAGEDERSSPLSRLTAKLWSILTIFDDSCGRYHHSHRHASKRGGKRPQTIYFLGLILYCTAIRKAIFGLVSARKGYDADAGCCK